MRLGTLAITATLAAALPFAGPAAQAADWPTGPVEMIVPWAAGGGTDRVGRALANVLGEQLGVAVPVLNRPGGTGVVGHTALAQSTPDGHTIGFITPQLLTAPILGMTDLGVDDLRPVALVNEDPGAVTVSAESPWQTLEEFLDHASANPGAVRVGNSGPGGTWHIVAVTLEREADLNLIHTPYDGAAPAITDMLGGHIEAVTVSAVEVGPQVEGGLARMLAVTAAERLDTFPDVPTAAEAGLDVQLGTWRGFAVAKDTPDEIVQEIEDALRAAVESDAFQDFMREQGFGAAFLGADDFVAYLERQQAAYESFFADQND